MLISDERLRELWNGIDHGVMGSAITFARAVEAEAYEAAAKVCDDYPLRDCAEDGNGYWAAAECAAAIRALKVACS